MDVIKIVYQIAFYLLLISLVPLIILGSYDYTLCRLPNWLLLISFGLWWLIWSNLNNRWIVCLAGIIFWSVLVLYWLYFVLLSAIKLFPKIHPLENFDVILVLGASVSKGVQTELQNRLLIGVQLWRQHPEESIIVSGGQGDDETETEAQAMKYFLLKQGIPDNKIIMEDKSRNTWENLQNSHRIFKDEKVAIVTSSFHIFRSLQLAKRQGINATGIGSPVPKQHLAARILREYFSWLHANYKIYEVLLVLCVIINVIYSFCLL